MRMFKIHVDLPVVRLLLLLLISSLTPTTTRGEIIDLTADEFYHLASTNQVDLIIDVRTESEWLVGHIENATLVESLQDRLLQATTTTTSTTSTSTSTGAQQQLLQRWNLWTCRLCRIIVYCRSGRRAAAALQLLEQVGFGSDDQGGGGQLYNGMGILQWTDAGYPLVTGPSKDDRPCMTVTQNNNDNVDEAVFRQQPTSDANTDTDPAAVCRDTANDKDNPQQQYQQYQRELDAARDLFLAQMQLYNATGYSYLLSISCFCPAADYPWLITASLDTDTDTDTTTSTTDTVISTITNDGNEYRPNNNHRVYSILDLFERIQQAVDQQAVAITVLYHPQWGYPQSIFIDFHRRVADDEFIATASNFSIVDVYAYNHNNNAADDASNNDNNDTQPIISNDTLAQEPQDGPLLTPMLSIQEQVALVFGSDYLEDPNSIQSQALAWILTTTTSTTQPTQDATLQRFIMVYFYLATSQQGPWISCNPATTGQRDFCFYLYLIDSATDPYRYTEIYWSRWLTPNLHECDWAGVTCNDEQQVIEIFLDAYDLTGSFPTELAQLDALNHISMTHNAFTGTLPRQLAQLTNLTAIELQSNQFSGLIPVEWTNIETLVHINVGLNDLIGSIPTEIGRLTALERLFLRNNELTGSLPLQLFELTNLAWVFLGGNNFVRTIPTEIGRLTNLEYLFMQGNPLTGMMPSEMGNLGQLRELALGSTFLSGTIPEELFIGGMNTWLNLLDLTSCQFTGTISSNIGLLQTCDWFLLGGNDFTGTIPTEASRMTGLKRFFVDGNDLTGTMPNGLCALRGGSGGLRHVKADCAPTASGDVPVECPAGCCTECCIQDSGICLPA